MENEENIIDLQCPKCKKMNRVIVSKQVKCHNCDNVITKKKSKKSIAILFVAITLAFGSGHAVDDFFEESRFSIRDEQALIENCIYGRSRYSMTKKEYELKKDICICALQKTQKNYFNLNDEKYRESFLKKLRENVSNCSTN